MGSLFLYFYISTLLYHHIISYMRTSHCVSPLCIDSLCYASVTILYTRSDSALIRIRIRILILISHSHLEIALVAKLNSISFPYHYHLGPEHGARSLVARLELENRAARVAYIYYGPGSGWLAGWLHLPYLSWP